MLRRLNGTIAGGGLNKKPVDPLKNTEYTYSSLAFGKAYQIKGEFEGDSRSGVSLGMPGAVGTAHAAAGDPAVAYITGNYGGISAKTATGGITYVLAVPSIITNTGTVSGNGIPVSSLSGTLQFSGKPLVRASSFNPGTVVFTGSSLPVSDANGEITAMVNNLRNAYSGSDLISANQAVGTVMSATDTGSLVSLGTSIISAQLGGSPSGGGGGGGGGGNAPDAAAPSITSVTAAQGACNNVRFTVNGAADAGGLAADAYSFDGGSTWQASNYRDFTGTSYTVNANLIKVRDSAGNAYSHASGVSGTSAACPVNCTYVTSQGSCNASC